MSDRSETRDGRSRLPWRRLSNLQKALLGIASILALVVIVARSPWGVERRYPQLPPEIAERERRVAYIRTVSDELGRAIASQDAIETSRVILNLPLPRAQDVTVSPDAKASVVVTFGEGYGEADADIDAVVALVANAVSGLTVERIVVADSSGQILAGAVQ